ncbi:ABC transporter substrate-binding protein [Natronospora cellulosivora (SeqCode)]
MKKSIVLVLCLMLVVSMTAFAGLGREAIDSGSSGLIHFEDSGITEFNQSPMLDERVESGELPPVEERLPLRPVVVVPENEVGEYGGFLRLSSFDETNLGIVGHVLTETPMMYNRDLDNIITIPNYIEDWEFTNDGKTLTMHIREGVRWSDGELLTSHNFVWWWENVINNSELVGVIAFEYRPGGEPMEVTAVDDYTVQLDFAIPHYGIMNYLNSYWYRGVDLFLPSHYLEQFHIDFNPEADKLAEEEGYDTWVQLINAHIQGGFTHPKVVGRPRLSAWIVTQETTTGRIYERNPYYYKVDTEGNQLPYIDGLRTMFHPDNETRRLSVLAGDVDYISSFLGLADYPTLFAGQESGNYDLWIGDDIWASTVTFVIQQNYQHDEGIAEILSDVRVRRALSLAIDREEINELVFMGQGEPRQLAFNPATVPVFKEEWENSYAEFDPEAAKALLDEAGIVDTTGDGWRNRPDGSELIINLLSNGSRSVNVDTCELTVEYWEAIGLRINMRTVDEGQFFQQMWEGETQIAAQFMVGEVPPAPQWNPAHITHWGYSHWLDHYNPYTGEFNEANVPEGSPAVEPPQEIIDWWTWGQNLFTVTGEEEEMYYELIGDYIAENVPVIGTVGMSGHVGVSARGLGNLRRVGDNPSIAATRNAYLEQAYWIDEARR